MFWFLVIRFTPRPTELTGHKKSIIYLPCNQQTELFYILNDISNWPGTEICVKFYLYKLETISLLHDNVHLLFDWTRSWKTKIKRNAGRIRVSIRSRPRTKAHKVNINVLPRPRQTSDTMRLCRVCTQLVLPLDVMHEARSLASVS